MPPSSNLICGTVKDSSGRPVKEARVMFASAPGPVADVAALTDAAGRFSLVAPIPGMYTLACHADGFTPGNFVAHVSGQRDVPVNIQLRPAP